VDLKSAWKQFAMSRDALKENNTVITKLAAMYLFRPFLWGSGVSRKTVRPYSDMKRLIPGVVVSIVPITFHDPRIYGN
jgi:hypothetical protein